MVGNLTPEAVGPSLRSVKDLYLLRRPWREQILAPGVAGVPVPVLSDGLIVRGVYVSARSDVDAGLREVGPGLEREDCSLLYMFESPDGSTFRSARIFVFRGHMVTPWHDGPYIRHDEKVLHFSVPSQDEGYSWRDDALMGEQGGWFLTGRAGQAGLWRVSRCEVDAFGHSLFTVMQVRSPFGLPALDLSRVSDTLLRAELLEQYQELQGSVARHGYRDVITKARNIIEGLFGWVLIENGEEPGRNLFEHLNKLAELVRQRKAPISDLSYHLAQKIRLVHARTHPAQASEHGRSVSPTFALSVIEDLKEILADLKMIRNL